MAELGTLHDAFLDELRYVYDGEKQLTRALPKMAKAACSAELRAAFDPSGRNARTDRPSRARLRGTRRKGQREALRRHRRNHRRGKRDNGRGFRRHHDGRLPDRRWPAGGAYEIAAYGTLIAWAKAMGHDEVAELLEQTLNEEKGGRREIDRAGRGRDQSAGGSRGGEEEEEEDSDRPSKTGGARSSGSNRASGASGQR